MHAWLAVWTPGKQRQFCLPGLLQPDINMWHPLGRALWNPAEPDPEWNMTYSV